MVLGGKQCRTPSTASTRDAVLEVRLRAGLYAKCPTCTIASDGPHKVKASDPPAAHPPDRAGRTHAFFLRQPQPDAPSRRVAENFYGTYGENP